MTMISSERKTSTGVVGRRGGRGGGHTHEESEEGDTAEESAADGVRLNCTL
jgi:hypothetical protein